MRTLVLLLLFCMTLSASAQQAVEVLNLPPIVIDSRVPWTATNIQVSAQDTLFIRVEGMACASSVDSVTVWNCFGPEGWGDYVPPSGFLLNGVAASSVIAKIGETGTPFFVGKGKILKALTGGLLFFGYNDSEWWDNRGQYFAFLNIRRAILPGVDLGDQHPGDMSVHQNYPNPFNPTTLISFSLPQRQSVKVKVFDVSGRLVNTVLDEVREPGAHAIAWDGVTSAGQRATSGTYFYSVETETGRGVKKMLLLK